MKQQTFSCGCIVDRGHADSAQLKDTGCSTLLRLAKEKARSLKADYPKATFQISPIECKTDIIYNDFKDRPMKIWRLNIELAVSHNN